MAKSISIGGIQPNTSSYVIAEQYKDSQTMTVVLTPDPASASKLKQELSFYLPGEFIEKFPDRETLPYDQFSPHHDIISERLRLLNKLPSLKKGILIASIETLMHRLPPPSFLAGYVLCLKTGESFDPLSQARLLEQAGYGRVNQVLSRGEFAIRGSIVDLYPMGSKDPIRIELFDNEIMTLRYFDPETQRSHSELQEINILPACEYPLDEKSIQKFIQKWEKKFKANTFKSPLLEAIQQKRSFGGLEYYLPLFFDETTYLFDYLPHDAQIIHLFNTYQHAESFWAEIEDRYAFCQHDLNRPALPPLEAFFHPTQVFSHTKRFFEVKLLDKILPKSPNQSNIEALALPEIYFNPHHEKPLEKLGDFLKDRPEKVLFCAQSAGRKEILLEHLSREKIKTKFIENFTDFLNSPEKTHLIIAPIEESFWLKDAPFLLLTEHSLFTQFIPQSRRRDKKDSTQQAENQASLIRDLGELKIHDAVVHVDHGVGRYLGLQTLSLGQDLNGKDFTSECLVIEYLEGDKLFVPIQNLHLITRYSGCEMQFAPISRLGTDRWQKDKEKAAKRVHDVAAELLQIYAQREAKPGFSFDHPKEDYLKFCAGFPFEETPDQLSAIAAVIDDMHAKKPMDRLLCGDVGFGKTEVAMRAAFIAAHQNKQVAVLVPTTLLAQQHYESFMDRFANWPVTIEMISRFRTPEQQKEILKKVQNNHVNILIGTHKLLSDEIKFYDLGLLIIDEEHRFGVKHKEQIKAMRTEVDILTLTATPIPRTLNLAFSNLRDLSLITTPPAKRLSVKTFVKEISDATIKEAISREVHRGGQVYYLFNDVSQIETRKAELQKIFPDLHIGIGHGQMRERELENVMARFYHNEYQILLCSTIIETGIDIPNANTIIIERADKFGLAQLHQLRGRVGRSHHQAYAYLLTPHWDSLTDDAKKRLEVIQEASHLGAGFTLASHDLEIRGAGELLGDEQSGQIERIGFNLYMELLDKTVHALKAGKTLDLNAAFESDHIEVDLGLSALIPEDYLGDVSMRLRLYKKISDAKTKDALDQIKSEMIDRFGPLPPEALNLLSNTHLKIQAHPLGISKIKASSKYISIEFKEKQQAIRPEKIISLLQRYPNRYKLKGQNSFLVHLENLKEVERLTVLQQVFKELG
jgi:transcription-repair coupling factor (superfamily II helicase)